MPYGINATELIDRCSHQQRQHQRGGTAHCGGPKQGKSKAELNRPCERDIRLRISVESKMRVGLEDLAGPVGIGLFLDTRPHK
jgi:hypothetical protein